MAKVVGFAPAKLSHPAARDNTSLGVAGTELVRRLNEALEHRLNQRQHAHLVRSAARPPPGRRRCRCAIRLAP